MGESLNDAEIEAERAGGCQHSLGKVSTLGLVKARMAEAEKVLKGRIGTWFCAEHRPDDEAGLEFAGALA